MEFFDVFQSSIPARECFRAAIDLACTFLEFVDDLVVLQSGRISECTVAIRALVWLFLGVRALVGGTRGFLEELFVAKLAAEHFFFIVDVFMAPEIRLAA